MMKKKTQKKPEKVDPSLTEEVDSSTPTESLYVPLDTSLVVSSGSTLLDLAISGNRIRGGGIPGGIILEIFGGPSGGKTALLVEVCASAQEKGGEVLIADPEARLDKEYASLFGLKIPREIYSRPDTVSELFDLISNWAPKNEDVINVLAADSIAAISTDMEMGEGDKRGQRKAKELSELCRKIGRKIAHKYQLVIFTNQERQGEYGKVTPGGFAVPYHASLRIRVARAGTRQIEAKKKNKSGSILTKVIGIESECTIVKSSISNEYQKAPIYIIFGHGIDDVRANLAWLKSALGTTKFPCIDTEYQHINQAVQYIEKNNLEAELRELTINTWEEIERLFKLNRKKKVRF